MRGLTGVSITGATSKGPIAVIQGGTLSGEAIQAVWRQGKTMVAGGCDCTGFVSPMLGGGHGWLQGQYGLITDNLISVRLVLGNSTAITVSSTENSDLYWGLRGAGQNFGIVSSVRYQVYDRKSVTDEGFATATYTFTQDKLESVFRIANQWIKERNRPVELTHYAIIANAPSIDSKPIINFIVYWQGLVIPTRYTDPLTALRPINVAKAYVDLQNANANTGASFNGSACAKGLSHQTFPVDLDEWDVKNLRNTLNIFSEMPAAGLGDSVMLLEGFAVNRVQAIPADSTAYPFRQHNLLVSPLLNYQAGNSTLDNVAKAYGERIRNTMLRNTNLQLSAYVNYAHGEESRQSIYGYEAWRLQRLRQLKRKYDPQGKFNFYVPIDV